MNLTRIIDIKERIAISDLFAPDERDFILECINTSIARQMREGGAVKHDPGNYLGRIDALWAALSIDEGGEGLCAAPFGAMTLPLIAADRKRLDVIIPVARQIAQMFGKPVRLAKFSMREDVEIYQP
jgi:hypothetical protein